MIEQSEIEENESNNVETKVSKKKSYTWVKFLIALLIVIWIVDKTHPEYTGMLGYVVGYYGLPIAIVYFFVSYIYKRIFKQ